MNNLSEKDLERIFREGLNNPEIDFHEDYWKQMEVLLDKRKSNKRRFVFWWWIMGIIGIASISGVYLKYNSGVNKERITENVINSGHDEKSQPTFGDNPDQLSIDLNVTETLLKEEARSSSIDKEISHQTNSDTPQKIRKSTIIDGEKNTSNDKSTSEKIKDRKIVVAKKDISEDQTEIRKTDETLIDNITVPEINNTRKLVEASIPASIALNPISQLTYIRNFKPPHIPVEVVKVSSSNWKFGFGIGPDWSATPSSNYGNSDLSMDVSINYLTTSKIVVFTGIGYMSDTYKAGMTDYKPQRGFWTRSIAPNSTTAMCKILSFPLGIKYFMSGAERSGLIISTAVVSQYMAREVYYYKYDIPEPDLIKNWMGSGESFHLFSSINISVGYRKHLMKRLYLGLSPYLNIPVKGIGHGNIKLSSTGIKMNIDF